MTDIVRDLFSPEEPEITPEPEDSDEYYSLYSEFPKCLECGVPNLSLKGDNCLLCRAGIC